MTSKAFLLYLVPIIMLLLAMLPFPYGYYTLLRIVICALCIFICYVEYKQNLWFVIALLFAITYNPLIHLTKSIWTPINVITALALIAHWFFRKEKIKEILD